MTLYEHIGQLYVALNEERAKIENLQKEVEVYKAKLMAKLMKEAPNEQKDQGADSQ